MYSLKMIQEANYKLNDSNPIDDAVGNALKNPSFIKRRNAKLNGAVGDTPKNPSFIKQRNEKLRTGAAEEPNKKTRRGKGRGRSKPNNVSAEDHNSHVDARNQHERAKMAAINSDAHVKAKEKHDRSAAINTDAHVKAKEEHDDTRARAKKINDKLVADAHADEFWKKRNAWKAATAWKTDKGNTALNAAKSKAANEEAKAREATLKRIEDNKAAAKAKLKAEKHAAGLAANILAKQKKVEDNKALKAAVNADAHVSARKKHLENKAKTSKQRKNRGAIAAAGLAATGGLIHQNRDAIKSAYDDI